MWGKATHFSGHVLHELGVFGEAPAAATVPQFAHVLSHPVALVEAHGDSVMQSHGCRPQAAPHSPDGSRSYTPGAPLT